MDITEVRIKLMDDPQERLQAFCSVTFDSCFVVRDLKIIEGAKGSFVAMPSRKLTDHCPQCHGKNHLRALYCNQCGTKLQEDRANKDDDGRAKLYADIAHPINSHCREMIQTHVLESYQDEVIRAKEPGYICRYDDYGEDSIAALSQEPDSSDAEPMTIGEADTVHRIDVHQDESVGNKPGTPHHAPTSAPGDERTVTANRNSNSEEDNFGAGIL